MQSVSELFVPPALAFHFAEKSQCKTFPDIKKNIFFDAKTFQILNTASPEELNRSFRDHLAYFDDSNSRFMLLLMLHHVPDKINFDLRKKVLKLAVERNAVSLIRASCRQIIDSLDEREIQEQFSHALHALQKGWGEYAAILMTNVPEKILYYSKVSALEQAAKNNDLDLVRRIYAQGEISPICKIEPFDTARGMVQALESKHMMLFDLLFSMLKKEEKFPDDIERSVSLVLTSTIEHGNKEACRKVVSLAKNKITLNNARCHIKFIRDPSLIPELEHIMQEHEQELFFRQQDEKCPCGKRA